MVCSACSEAPDYRLNDATNTAYCSGDCQKAHWNTHQTRCKALKQRVKLLRISKMLRTTLMVYRCVFYNLCLTKIELKDDTLWLHHTPTSKTQFPPFPDDLTTDRHHRDAALSVIHGATAMSILGPMTRELLTGESCLPIQKGSELTNG